MKIGIFTDSHYSSQEITCGNRYNSKSLTKIQQAYSFFEKNKCELIVCLGDLTDKEDSHEKEIINLRKIAETINQSRIPTVCIMGNHDAFTFEADEFYKILGGCKPQNIFSANKNLLFLDACHFKNGKHYMPGDSDWTDTYFPYPDELDKILANMQGDTYIFMHQNIDCTICEDHRLSNTYRIREILEKSSVVKAVYQGHYHPGNNTIHNGIEYITFPAMCENEKAYFVIDI